jgi:hypothetical protein
MKPIQELDGGPKRACKSPKTYKGLTSGKHRLKVWATAAGKTDPNAMSYPYVEV